MANNAALNAFTRAAAGCRTKPAPAAAQLHAAKTATDTDVFTDLTYLPDTDTPTTTDVFVGLTYLTGPDTPAMTGE